MAKFFTAAVLAALLAATAQGQTPAPTRKPPEPLTNERPSVKLVPSVGEVTLAPLCYEDQPVNPLCTGMSPKVKLSARATDPDGDTLLYTYSTTGGRVEGEGPEVVLDLTDAAPGYHKVTVEVDDGNGGVATAGAEIMLARCTCPLPPPIPPRCPTVNVRCPDVLDRAGRLTFTANVSGGDAGVTPTYNWTVSAGTISGGQGTGSITVDAQGVRYGVFTATVEVAGYDRSCRTSSSCTIVNEPPRLSRKVDEYGDIKLKDEWARLDNFAAELRNDPTAQGFFVCYGGRRSTAGEAQRRCDRAERYTSRFPWASDPSRLVTVDAGYRCEPLVELWLVPSGAEPPADAPLTIPASKPSASKCRPPGRRVRR